MINTNELDSVFWGSVQKIPLSNPGEHRGNEIGDVFKQVLSESVDYLTKEVCDGVAVLPE
jgi:hypothetical protein